MPLLLSSPALDTPPTLLWPAAWRRPGFRVRLLVVLGLLLGLISWLPRFFAYIQVRPGHLLPDPLLAALPALDVSWPTFIVIYSSAATALLYIVPRPLVLLRTLTTYLLMQTSRVLLLTLLPLEPPPGLLPLHDPLLDRFIYVAAGPITKDLFFSGHTATMLILALAVGPGRRRSWLLAATVAVGTLVLVQHVHYTYDVLAAPLFVWGCWRLAGRVADGALPAPHPLAPSPVERGN